MITCKRCGLCCHYLKNKVWKKCKYLIGKTFEVKSCRIYSHKSRKNVMIDKGVRCINRESSPLDYPGCPYNTNKPILTIVAKEKIKDGQ